MTYLVQVSPKEFASVRVTDHKSTSLVHDASCNQINDRLTIMQTFYLLTTLLKLTPHTACIVLLSICSDVRPYDVLKPYWFKLQIAINEGVLFSSLRHTGINSNSKRIVVDEQNS